MTPPANPSPRILLVRFGAMGDIIHALPAAGAIRVAFPGAAIDWLVEPRWQGLLLGTRMGSRPLLDRVITLDTFALRKSVLSTTSRQTLRALVRQLRASRYDTAVDLQGAIKSALACKLSGASRILGFAAPWIREGAAGLLYSRSISSPARHIVEANLDLAAALTGQPANHADISFPLPEGDPAALPDNLPQQDFAVMNPGAGWRSKQWPPACFAAVCDELQLRHGLPTILNCGPGEQALAAQVRSGCQHAAPAVFSGEIPALIALLRHSRLMVGPDTGPLHLAAALGVPTVGIFGPTDPARNGPYGPAVRSLRAPGARTSHKHDADPDGSMQAITPAQVLAAVDELLHEQAPA